VNPAFTRVLATATEIQYILGRAMDFEWDDNKAALNKVKHGVTFQDGIQVFEDPNCQRTDTTRLQDNEVRGKVVGLVDGVFLTVIFTFRGAIVRVISVRRSNKPEERAYGDR
jgi:uncharacterized protein